MTDKFKQINENSNFFGILKVRPIGVTKMNVFVMLFLELSAVTAI